MALDQTNFTTEPRGRRPGRFRRKGLTMKMAYDLWSDEEKATAWLESVRWPDGLVCPRCGSGDRAHRTKHDMPYRCGSCRKYFSLKMGTPMADSKIAISDWILTVFHDLTNLKGVSSMKLYRDLGVKQEHAWHMIHRIREAFMSDEPPAEFADGGEFAIDEAYIGGREGNKHAKDKIPGGQGGSTKQIVIGITHIESGKMWADVIPDTLADTIAETVNGIIPAGSTVFTDEARHYGKIDADRYAVNHSIGEYVRTVDMADGLAKQVTTNHTESAWSMLKRAVVGVHHKMSPKHLRRYVKSFAGRWNIRHMDTEAQMRYVFTAMIGRKLTYDTLTADNGLPSGSGPNGAYYPERRRRYQKPRQN